MSARSIQEEVLPEMGERRRILEHAGTVLAEARSLLESLDHSEGRLHVRDARASGLKQGILVRIFNPKRMPEAGRWWS